MAEAKTVNISQIKFSSTAFPTAEDRALWESLTPEQQLEVLRRDEREGYDSGTADHASLADILAEARFVS
jgi:hypothetical protein